LLAFIEVIRCAAMGERSGDEGVLSVSPTAKLTASSACRKSVGNSLPRFSARRNIPWAALALKKYFGSGATSKMADKEHTAALGDSKN
jgi:hypothetical protein